jgi:hypothetical protein
VAQGPADLPTSDRVDWPLRANLRERGVSSYVEARGDGMMRVRLAAALAPGDYAIVLRPAFLKDHAGARVLCGVGDGLAFSTAWPFSVG